MRTFARVLCALSLLLVPLAALATTVLPLTLEDMVGRADHIFRGVVINAEPGTIAAAGGIIPITTYRIKVDDPIKGKFDTIKGARVIELRLLRAGTAIDLPEFQVGESYLMLTTRPSIIGMSTTVGLKQGYFRVHGSTAVDGYGRSRRYEPLVANIRAIIEKGGGQ